MRRMGRGGAAASCGGCEMHGTLRAVKSAGALNVSERHGLVQSRTDISALADPIDGGGLFSGELAAIHGYHRVGDAVVKSGYSHRYFAKIFEEVIALTPKTYCRVVQFGRVLDRLQEMPNAVSYRFLRSIGQGGIGYPLRAHAHGAIRP